MLYTNECHLHTNNQRETLLPQLKKILAFINILTAVAAFVNSYFIFHRQCLAFIILTPHQLWQTVNNMHKLDCHLQYLFYINVVHRRSDPGPTWNCARMRSRCAAHSSRPGTNFDTSCLSFWNETSRNGSPTILRSVLFCDTMRSK